MKAPDIASAPPTTHAPRIRKGVCTWCATTEGLRKIPDPTMPPITIMVASKSPSWRRIRGASKRVGYHAGVLTDFSAQEVLLHLAHSIARQPLDGDKLPRHLEGCQPAA